MNADFGSTDLQMIADKMVASLLASNRLQPDPADPGKPPLVSVTRLRNDTSEHIDTKSITDKIRTAAHQVRQGALLGPGMQSDLMDQYKLQGTMADTATAKTAGKQTGSKYILRRQHLLHRQADRARSRTSTTRSPSRPPTSSPR